MTSRYAVEKQRIYVCITLTFLSH
jgi:glucan endo-1,3-beta-D-glucosidase